MTTTRLSKGETMTRKKLYDRIVAIYSGNTMIDDGILTFDDEVAMSIEELLQMTKLDWMITDE